MVKKVLSILVVSVLMFTLLAIPAIAAPYETINIKAGDNTIEAVHFDTDDYSDDGASDAKYEARPEMEDAGGPQTEIGSSGYEGNVGWTNGGEWVQYTVNFESAGKATFSAEVASGNDVGLIDIYIDDALIGQASSDGSTDWQDWLTSDIGSVDVTAGTHVIKVEFVNGNINLAALLVNLEGAAVATDAPTEAETAAPADDADGDATTAAAEGETTTAASDKGEDEGINVMLLVIIAAAAVIVIIIIVVLVTKKKPS